MSISRGCGRGETSAASATSWSVVVPIAETTPTTCRPVSWAATSRSATLRILSASATDEPPNFITSTRVGWLDGSVDGVGEAAIQTASYPGWL